LAVEEHRGLVLLALADHHHPVEVHGGQERANRVHRRAVRGELVALADERHRTDGGGLGRSYELEGEVPVRLRHEIHTIGHWGPPRSALRSKATASEHHGGPEAAVTR